MKSKKTKIGAVAVLVVLVFSIFALVYVRAEVVTHEYDYAETSYMSYGWSVKSVLKGTYVDSGRIQEQTNPYDLMLWVKAPLDIQDEIISIELKSLKLTDVSGAVLYSSASHVSASRITDDQTSFFWLDNVNLASHEDIHVSFILVVNRKDGGVVEETVIEIMLEAVHRVKRSNRIIDGILSA